MFDDDLFPRVCRARAASGRLGMSMTRPRSRTVWFLSPFLTQCSAHSSSSWVWTESAFRLFEDSWLAYSATAVRVVLRKRRRTRANMPFSRVQRATRRSRQRAPARAFVDDSRAPLEDGYRLFCTSRSCFSCVTSRRKRFSSSSAVSPPRSLLTCSAARRTSSSKRAAVSLPR